MDGGEAEDWELERRSKAMAEGLRHTMFGRPRDAKNPPPPEDDEGR